MLLGIDVGGTFTDAVLVDNGAVHAPYNARRGAARHTGGAGCRYGRRGRGKD